MEPAEVVRSHLVAVQRGDPVAMAADYAVDALLERAGQTYEGHAAIAAYFTSVGGRLGGGEVVFGEPVWEPDGSVIVRWRIDDGPSDGVSGSDRFVVKAGRIVHQQVHLDADDF